VANLSNQSAVSLAEAERSLDWGLIHREYPHNNQAIYLNTGSCGRKPTSVIAALNRGWEKLNVNPTFLTFMNKEPFEMARTSAAALFEIEPKQLLLTQNTTHGLQIILQSFLRKAGDELVTTTQEHGSVKALIRHLAETRGVVTRYFEPDPFAGSVAFCQGLLQLVNLQTKLVLVSEIGSYTGWRPDLTTLQKELSQREIPLLVDGAHGPGQIICHPNKYKLWVSSGHKWLGGPNGTGFLYASSDMVPSLEPVEIGDEHFNRKDKDINDITRLESIGTSDVVRWYGLAQACKLQEELNCEFAYSKQLRLAQYLREQLEKNFSPTFRVPDIFDHAPNEATAMVVCYWPQSRLRVSDLREALWQKLRLWTQPDFLIPNPGLGMRISCHVSNTKQEIDLLLEGLRQLIVA
jgi:selenocysteine lyase/cysteine desulfurase